MFEVAPHPLNGIESLAQFNVHNLPEWQLLRGDTMADSPEAVGLGVNNPEVQRTLCSINCLEYLLSGSDEDYAQLTTAQNPAVKLKRDQFATLHEWTRQTLPTQAAANTMRYIMLVHDAGKNMELFTKMGLQQGTVDHDQAFSMLLSLPEYADARASLLPTFQHISAPAQDQIKAIASIPLNFGQFMQGEAPAQALTVLDGYSAEPIRSMYVLHAILDIAGVAGHINADSSLVLTSSIYQSMEAAHAALTQPGLNAARRYNQYLQYRAQQFGVEASTLESSAATIAQVRLGCMLRCDSSASFAKIAEAFTSLPSPAQDILTAELARDGINDRATLPYYGPALLKSIVDKRDIVSAFNFFAHVLQEAHIADKAQHANNERGVITADLGPITTAINNGDTTCLDQGITFVRNGEMLTAVVS